MESKEAITRFLNVQGITITNYIDKWIKCDYLFSKE